ncbi:cobalamin biosynthesis protein [Acidiphilium sp.]|uniref:cobalamin biosynthesis protein n=1 Tax=Acidiphilium sp. TaxID=527 RepID=UPI002588C07B|nr:cobalamin biosynthesis protein [Acidiphilium sp.]
MRVAGLGFRNGTTPAALAEAIAAAGGGALSSLATAADKAEAPPLLVLAAELGLSVTLVPLATLANTETLTRSPRVAARYGTGSLAEAAALGAAGSGARLLGPRATSADGTATAAIATTETTV